jgi:hypothetical protein
MTNRDLIAELQKKDPEETAMIAVLIGDASGNHREWCCVGPAAQEDIDDYEADVDVGDLCVTVQL